MPMDEPREACGVAGVWQPAPRHGRAARLVRTMLLALQHRGEQSAGLAVVRDGALTRHVGSGRVEEALPAPDALPAGHGAIGHVRYATSGTRHARTETRAALTLAQPVTAGAPGRPALAVAHNGTLQETGGEPGEPDTVALARALHAAGGPLLDALCRVLPRVRGAYSLVLTDGQALFGVRDPHGFRPLCLGRAEETWLLASETAALEAVGARVVRELEPGEIVRADASGLSSTRLPVPPVPPSLCLFEYVYFARADSRIGARDVHQARYEAGLALAAQAPPPDGAGGTRGAVVVAVPDTARVAADGYAWAAGLPLVQGLLRHRGVGRSFLGGTAGEREAAVRAKLTAVPAALAGRSVVLVDDSLVRGTTLATVVAMVRAAGARGVHVRLASPPHRWPCFYGIDTGRGDTLLAAEGAARVGGESGGDSDGALTTWLAERLGCDSVGFLSLPELLRTVNAGEPGAASHCTACLDGRYPTPVPAPLLNAGATEGRSLVRSEASRSGREAEMG
ncbi:amidophosphoribosyltransferase [Streptomyces sp. NPDC048172]|uniref:amidophosphoribosyltransferase n=1 Tax=Streptomyces sp. NPDC048172 TaxID=3365505 RepID=UPI003712F74E